MLVIQAPCNNIFKEKTSYLYKIKQIKDHEGISLFYYPHNKGPDLNGLCNTFRSVCFNNGDAIKNNSVEFESFKKLDQFIKTNTSMFVSKAK